MWCSPPSIPRPASTLFASAIGTVIRGLIGFDGLLMSDDLSMKALGGGFAERARRALDAGCDVSCTATATWRR